MRSSKVVIRWVLLLACAVISVAGLINVYAGNDDVLEQARGVACPGHAPCVVARMDRTPFAQTFEFRAGSATVSVRCARSAVFFGEYACAR